MGAQTRLADLPPSHAMASRESAGADRLFADIQQVRDASKSTAMLECMAVSFPGDSQGILEGLSGCDGEDKGC